MLETLLTIGAVIAVGIYFAGIVVLLVDWLVGDYPLSDIKYMPMALFWPILLFLVIRDGRFG